MISVADAQSRILAMLPHMPAEQIGLATANNRILAAPVVARTTQPPVAISAMDGYAVQAGDVTKVPATLRVVDRIPAGKKSNMTLGSGEAARIFTGAPLPAGADAIVIQENAEEDRKAGTVLVHESVSSGRYVRPAGLDFSLGEALIDPGTKLGPRAIGLAAAMNVPWLSVARKPRIALLATGDEIVLPGSETGATRIVSSNNFALAGLIEDGGGIAVDLGIAADNEIDLTDRALGAAGCDMLVTTGGASVGDHDLIQPVLGKMGLSVDFWKIAMRPGKPLIFGQFAPKNDTMAFLGLPGNPVSSLVCGLLFLAPAIAKMTGRNEAGILPHVHQAVLGEQLKANDSRQTYLRARLTLDNGGTTAHPFSLQDSSMMRTMHEADCLIIRRPGAPAAPKGETTDILHLEGF